MSGLRFQHRLGVLLLAAQLQACHCDDQMRVWFTPHHDRLLSQGTLEGVTWLDSQTLEIEFYGWLRAPTDVEPRRFALTRYNVTYDGYPDSVCQFEVCYRELDTAVAVPESLSWDGAKPNFLRLHFAEPISPSYCDEWGNRKAEVHALALIYLAGDPSDEIADPDLLAFSDGRGVDSFGPREGGMWVNCHWTEENCEYDSCIDLSVSFGDQIDVLVDCP
jgi:hypothetical protein